MKKTLAFAIAAIVVMATLMLQGCNNSEAASNKNEERIADATERVADALEEMVPRSITDRESGSTVGWSSLSLEERHEVLDAIGVASAHHCGDPIRPNPSIHSVSFVLYLVDVPSPIENQTLLEYSYKDASGKAGKNRILVQGHLETSAGDGIIPIESIPYVLNDENCCYLYGGCINGSTCDEQRPKAKECTPCETNKKEQPCEPKPKVEQPCKPCQQGQGPKRTLDGASTPPASNGKSKTLPTVDF